MARHLILVSAATQTCGVEEFARQTAVRLGSESATCVLDRGLGGFGAALRSADDVVINLPLLAWKRHPLLPILAAARARLARRDVTLILHEWADLALARRVTYLPLLPLVTRLLFSSPEIMAQFAATPVSAVVSRRRAVVPIPPNVVAPDAPAIENDRTAAGPLVLAQFGSIYPRKDPLTVLDVAAELVRRGIDVHVRFIGSFVGDGVETEFWRHAEALRLHARVEVSGYIADSDEIYRRMREADVLLYPLSEGLTSRRGSVLAAALSGRPVVVSAPEREDSLSHHRLFKALVASGAIQFAPRGASPSVFADAVLAARGTRPVRVAAQAEIDGIWRDVAASLDAPPSAPLAIGKTLAR